MEFMTLREFLSLTQDGQKDRLYAERKKAYDFIVDYDRAKKSWEKYSDGNSIPIGSKVKTLVSGHGGLSGTIRKFEGVFEHDLRFFVISCGNDRSIVFRQTWFKEFAVID